jgi:hypothetical protein
VSQIDVDRGYKNFDDKFGLYGDSATELLQQALINVVTETVSNYPNFFISEKTIKPISTMRPFLVIAPKNTLEELKNLGFKTFDRWWDEGYDRLDDPVERILAVLDIVKNMSKKSIHELQNMCQEMKDVLEHNHEYYNNDFYDIELKKLHDSCKKNLGYR